MGKAYWKALVNYIALLGVTWEQNQYAGAKKRNLETNK
jgi:hypothetical protein